MSFPALPHRSCLAIGFVRQLWVHAEKGRPFAPGRSKGNADSVGRACSREKEVLMYLDQYNHLRNFWVPLTAFSTLLGVYLIILGIGLGGLIQAKRNRSKSLKQG
jgi:hypothetical protein